MSARIVSLVIALVVGLVEEVKTVREGVDLEEVEAEGEVAFVTVVLTAVRVVSGTALLVF